MSMDSVPRDDVAQEDASPAALRDHLRIYVFTQVEQIVVRNEYEWEAFKMLKKHSYDHAKFLEPTLLTMEFFMTLNVSYDRLIYHESVK